MKIDPPDKVTKYDHVHLFDEEDEVEPICKLETVEFVKIILVWAYETYKYKSKRGVIALKEAEMVMNWIEQKMLEVQSIENESIK